MQLLGRRSPGEEGCQLQLAAARTVHVLLRHRRIRRASAHVTRASVAAAAAPGSGFGLSAQCPMQAAC